MADWDPALYTRFEDERTRPARELLQRVPLTTARTVVDLGCGPGNSTELLAARFPEAALLGIDSSAAMIAESRKRLPECRFDKADIEVWRPESPPDLIYANAALQWTKDHETLIPRLFQALAKGGALAVQMPDNLDEPSHASMRDVAHEEPWAGRLTAALAARSRLPSLDAYYDLLAPEAVSVDVWRTVYHHPMASPGHIVDWVRATGLRPFIEALPDEERGAFLDRYERRIDVAYPARADGLRLLRFPRIFIVAVRQLS